MTCFKFQVLLIYSKQLKLLLGWLANSKKLIAASQTVHRIIQTIKDCKQYPSCFKIFRRHKDLVEREKKAV